MYHTKATKHTKRIDILSVAACYFLDRVSAQLRKKKDEQDLYIKKQMKK